MMQYNLWLAQLYRKAVILSETLFKNLFYFFTACSLSYPHVIVTPALPRDGGMVEVRGAPEAWLDQKYEEKECSKSEQREKTGRTDQNEIRSVLTRVSATTQ